MTMADTIAVMNEGRIEQTGSPAELYDNPATTFVANFLGQSNLIRGTVVGEDGSTVVLDVHGARVTMPAARSRVTSGQAYVGVRPEKLVIAREDDPAPAGERNELTGVVADVCFIGVSTEYLVRTPWGQELTVFAQNNGAEAGAASGDRVRLRWSPAHTFALDAGQPIDAGTEDGAEPGLKPASGGPASAVETVP